MSREKLTLPFTVGTSVFCSADVFKVDRQYTFTSISHLRCGSNWLKCGEAYSHLIFINCTCLGSYPNSFEVTCAILGNKVLLGHMCIILYKLTQLMGHTFAKLKLDTKIMGLTWSPSWEVHCMHAHQSQHTTRRQHFSCNCLFMHGYQ